MAKKLSGYPDAGTLTGDELVPVIKGGKNKRTTVTTLLEGAADAIGTAVADEAAARAAADLTKLPLAGGTLTGALVLPGNAGAALQAVPKQQLDAGLAAKQDTIPPGTYVPSAEAIKTTGAQSKTGVLTLTDAPVLPVGAVPRSSLGLLELENVLASNWALWTAALDRVRAGTGNARLHFYGDSLTWGSASTQPYDTNAFAERVRAAIAATVPNTKVGTVFPVPSSTSRYALTGAWTQSVQFGIANAVSILGQPGAGSATFGPFTCDTFRVYFPTNTGLGSFDWAVDGVAGGTVSTNAATNVTYVDLPAGALGSHTLTLSNATATLYIYGVEARGGTSSLYVARGGVGGTTSGSWATNASFLNSIRAAFVSQPADLYVIELGINDWYQQVSPATYAANMTTIVNAAKAAGGAVLLLAAPTPNAVPSPGPETNNWAAYVAQIAAVAVATSVSWCSMDSLLGARKNSLLYTDGIHWSDALHSEVAAALTSALLGSSRVSVALAGTVGNKVDTSRTPAAISTGSAGAISTIWTAAMGGTGAAGARYAAYVRNANFSEHSDPIAVLGYNPYGSADYDSSKPDLFLAFEGSYWDGVQHKSEVYFQYDPAVAAITNKALTSNVATLSAAAGHKFRTGDVLTLAGLGAPFDGTGRVVASTPSTTTFTVAITAGDVASAAATGTATAGFQRPFYSAINLDGSTPGFVATVCLADSFTIGDRTTNILAMTSAGITATKPFSLLGTNPTLSVGNSAVASDGVVVIDSASANGSVLKWQRGGAASWQMYRSPGSDVLFLRDMLNAKMHATFTGGAGTGGTTEVNSALKVMGNAGFYGTTPIAKPSAFTQTYATADKTHAARTATAVATTAATNSSPYGYTQAQADDIVTQINNLRTDHLDTAQALNSLIDDLQALGLVG